MLIDIFLFISIKYTTTTTTNAVTYRFRDIRGQVAKI